MELGFGKIILLKSLSGFALLFEVLDGTPITSDSGSSKKGGAKPLNNGM